MDDEAIKFMGGAVCIIEKVEGGIEMLFGKKEPLLPWEKGSEKNVGLAGYLKKRRDVPEKDDGYKDRDAEDFWFDNYGGYDEREW